MKQILFCMLLIAGFSIANAQKKETVQTVLDRTATAFKKNAGLSARFTATSLTGTTEQGKVSGVFYLKGNKFHLKSPTMLIWFDGKTQWTYNVKNEEINISTPTAAELQSVNPYFFINLYKKGYTHSYLDDSTTGNKSCYNIRLLAQTKGQDIQEIILTVDKTTSHLYNVQMRQGTNKWTHIRIASYSTDKPLTDAQFRFRAADYPNAEVIDLR